MWKYAIILLALIACEKQPIEIQSTPNYLFGTWREMDENNFEWTFENNKFSRELIGRYGQVARTASGYYERNADSIYLYFQFENQIIINPPATMFCKILKLDKEDMIWSINDFELIFRKL